MTATRRISICDVGTRDGFQIEPQFIPTAIKVEVVDRLTEAGLPEIEVTSFVHPKVVPQLKDAEDVMRRIHRRPGTVYAALVPNERGAMRAIDAGADQLNTVLSASESHNLANVNMTVADSLDKLEAVVRAAQTADIAVQGGISTSFGCPFETQVSIEKLESIVSRLVSFGVSGIALADTTGMANPAQVKHILQYLMPKFPAVQWRLHTHNTRAMAIPNVLAAIDCGVTHFDASIGGLGGCPFAPGATGNVCTEDLVHCIHAMGFYTGIDLQRLIATAHRVEAIIGRPLPGQVMKAGPWDKVYALPERVAERVASSTS